MYFQVDWSRQTEKEGNNDMDRFKVSILFILNFYILHA